MSSTVEGRRPASARPTVVLPGASRSIAVSRSDEVTEIILALVDSVA
jgi:hypothetical protein